MFCLLSIVVINWFEKELIRTIANAVELSSISFHITIHFTKCKRKHAFVVVWANFLEALYIFEIKTNLNHVKI